MDENTRSICNNLISMRNSRVQSERVVELTGKYEKWLKFQALSWKNNAELAYTRGYFKVAYGYEKIAKEIEEVLDGKQQIGK